MSRSQPQLSVAIAARNHARWLPRCLDSVLNSVQRSGARVEIVVADDCSTDGTAGVLESYAHRHPGIIGIVRAATCDGVPAIKNLAMRRSSGALVALHDADDEFAPDKVARCLDAFAARPGADLLTHDFTFIDANGERSVSTDDWFGSWRPNGVWVFPRGRVGFNEQMVCGYEELEWSRRHWRSLTRLHRARARPVGVPPGGAHLTPRGIVGRLRDVALDDRGHTAIDGPALDRLRGRQVPG